MPHPPDSPAGEEHRPWYRLRLFHLPPLLIALCAALLLGMAGGADCQSPAPWAFTFLKLVPMWLRWSLGALVLLGALPVAWRWPRAWSDRGASRGWPGGRVGQALALAVSLCLFWWLRERTWHGDALYKLALLRAVPLVENPYVWKEPLDSLLEYGMTAAVAPWGGGPEVAIALLSVAAGGVYLASCWAVTGWLARGWDRGRLLVALLASGSTLLWFGHVENYSWSTALAFATVALALGHLDGRLPLWPVGLVAGAAVSFHPQAAFILPGLAFLLRRERWPHQVTTLALTGAIFPLLTCFLLLALGVPWPTVTGGGFAGDPQLFWTPAQALAPDQLADAVQNLWLVVPLWPLWFAAILAGLGRPPRWREQSFALLAGVGLGLLVYFFAFQNDLPRWRDWDLFAIVGPPLALWGGYAWLRLEARAPSPGAVASLRRSLNVGLLFAAAYTACWIGVNHTYTLVQPDPNARAHLLPYRLLDLTELMPQARVTPDTPICDEAEGCERVALTTFVMPQNGDARPTLFAHAPAAVVFPLSLPDEPTFLWLSPALDPQAWDWGGDGVTFVVKVRRGGTEETLWQRHVSPQAPSDRAWLQALVPLDAYRGQAVELVLVTDPGPAGDSSADRAGWGMPWLMRGTVYTPASVACPDVPGS